MAEADRQEALGLLSSRFREVGQRRVADDQEGLGSMLEGLSGEFTEFLNMPLDLARIFINMGLEMAELAISTLEEAGFVLVKGLTPA